MRILQVVQGLPPESLGGTEMYVAHLSRELLQRGHDVRVFSRIVDTCRSQYSVDAVFMEGIPVTRINNAFGQLERFSRSYTNPEVARRFGDFLDIFSPQVVHFHHLMYLSTTCIQEATRRKIPVVLTLHDYWLICQRGRFLKPDLSVCPGQTDEGCARCFAHLLDSNLVSVYRKLKPMLGARSWLKDRLRHLHGRYIAFRRPSVHACEQIRQRMVHVREICREVDLFLAPSRFLREQFLAFGIPANKILYLECGLPPQETIAMKRTGAHAPPIFAYIGVMDAVKGVHLLVEAFQGITNAELRLYGGEADYAAYPDRQRFLNQIDRSPHIRLMGRYENHEIGNILSQVDVVVVPSIWYENAPLVIREAFQARKPVITADLGGMREAVHDEVTGLLFQPRQVEDLRRKINRFVADPGLVDRLAYNIPPIKSMAENAKELEAEYQVLCNRTS